MPELSKPIISLRSLARRGSEIREAVTVVHLSRVIGEFIPAPRAAQDDEDRGAKTADPVDAPRVGDAPGRLGAPESTAGALLARTAQAERDKVLRRVARGGKSNA